MNAPAQFPIRCSVTRLAVVPVPPRLFSLVLHLILPGCSLVQGLLSFIEPPPAPIAGDWWADFCYPHKLQ